MTAQSAAGARALLLPYLNDAAMYHDGLRLLAAQRDAWNADHPAAWLRRADAALDHQPDRPPQLRLLYIARWSRELGPDARVFLQGLDDDLYLRIQGTPQPDRVRLVLRGDRPVIGAFHATPRARRFALSYLNGGGPDGLLWYTPDLSASGVLSRAVDRGTELMLEVGTGNCSRLLGPVSIPTNATNGRPSKMMRAMTQLIGAYTSADPRVFRASLRVVSRQRDTWRVLSPMQNLWLSAMRAELALLGPAVHDRYGCGVLAGHPQLIESA